VADRCGFSLDELRYEYPPEVCPPGRTPLEHLAELTWAGARQRYSERIPDRTRRLIEHELRLIGELRYEHYFLTVWDLVRYARSRGILCQGRGSAANSAVCYCLGVTSVDPDRIDLLFERFVSAERNEPPDIDVDFEHERREEVLQYVYEKYGRDRAGIAAEVITYRPKSAVRDVGKALGFSQDRLDALSKKVEWWSDPQQMTGHLATAGMDPTDFTVRCLTSLCRQIIGFPRHLSQHVGGFVITAGPLCELVPIENAAMPDRTFIEWDKDDIDALGILKIDCLALGMLTAIRKAFDLIAEGAEGAATDDPTADAFARSLLRKDANERLALVPAEDAAVYDMICHADTVGVFQVESRAQMSMLPRLRPRCFYDLVIEVAIVRPGPIQGGMVHPYLRRRQNKEPVTYPSEAVRVVLAKTLGVPLFQEQAMRLAIVAAGFTPGEADQLRRSMGAWRRSGSIDKFGVKLIEGMRANGYNETFAEQLFNQIRGFGEYGFPESHAASFALLVYVSAWLKRYYPAAFAAALINSQPMGFYAPAQLVRDAREHGVRVLPVDVNHSDYDCALEGGRVAPAPGEAGEPSERWGERGPALRLGFRLIKGISQSGARGIADARRIRPFTSLGHLARRGGAPRAVLARLAAADAMRSLGLDRRRALWSVLALDDAEELPLFAGLDCDEPPAALPEMMLNEHVVSDYQTTGLSLKAHPMSLIRSALGEAEILTAKAANAQKQGRRVRVAGLVLVRQRPSTALGIIFMTIEDETGVVNLVVKPKVYERYRAAAQGATALVVQGKIEREGEVVHVMVESMASVTNRPAELRVASRDFH
jgi:error-prone DNA polymerase